MEQVTLWLEARPKLYIGIAEIVAREPKFVLRMPYSYMKAEVIGREMNSHYHHFCISPELNDKAATFWPYQFWLSSLRATSDIVVEDEVQWMYLQFMVSICQNRGYEKSYSLGRYRTCSEEDS